ncbi:MAG: T9SS type A sorting domain-containing protein [Bacteroidota bacterium]|nr:T9SS type A sorting domain-containing protein [Bacteroidota bacterium]MDE2955567.1 T9SS type A sorting domain-containing protein [Bacteroidota bacterium]
MRTFLLVFSLLLPASATAQNWVSMGGFPDDNTWTTYMHGLAVDAEGKVWVGPWPTYTWVTASGDTVRDANGEALSTRTIHVYNPDGTVAMEPIRTITVGGETDTLLSNVTIRGLRADHNGNILLVLGGSSMMYRINHQTGEGMDKVFLDIGSPAAPGVDANGNIFVAAVVPGAPIKIYGPDFMDTGVIAADSSKGFSRAFEVSADGNAVYWVGYSNRHILKYTRADEFSEFNYTMPDTLHWGLISESNHRNPATGNIWFGHSQGAGVEPSENVDLGYGFGSEDQLLTWYELDTMTDELVDSLKVTLIHPWDQQKTRAIAFAPDGKTAYVALWETNLPTPLDPPEIAVYKFVKTETSSIERDAVGVPEQFTLSQNYPNPFNPQTKIEFDLMEAGAARMAVYDILGREVRVLIDEHLQAGRYTVTFSDTGNLPSGVYLYRLMVNGQSLSGRMILSK